MSAFGRSSPVKTATTPSRLDAAAESIERMRPLAE
jgi:hypothetical protein